MIQRSKLFRSETFPSLLRPEAPKLSGTCSSSFKGRGNKGALKPVELIEAAGGGVVTYAYGEMLGEARGATVAASVWSVVTFGNRKMLRIDWFAERAEALKAVGLQE